MNRDHLDHDQAPPHPGEILREDILPALAMSRAALARHLGISIGRLSSLLAEGRPVTLDLAVRLGAALGHGSRYWLGLQVQHDIWRAEQAMPASVTPVRWPPRRRHGADVTGPLVPAD
jgi:addiction module HigA family antidote